MSFNNICVNVNVVEKFQAAVTYFALHIGDKSYLVYRVSGDIKKILH